MMMMMMMMTMMMIILSTEHSAQSELWSTGYSALSSPRILMRHCGGGVQSRLGGQTDRPPHTHTDADDHNTFSAV